MGVGEIGGIDACQLVPEGNGFFGGNSSILWFCVHLWLFDEQR